jgi:hypothetical protein
MNNTLIQSNTIEEAKQQIFDIILTLNPKQQNEIIKSMKTLFIEYRFKKMKEAESEFKRKQDLFHDIAS